MVVPPGDGGDGRSLGEKTIAEVPVKRIGPVGVEPYGQKYPNKTNGLSQNG